MTEHEDEDEDEDDRERELDWKIESGEMDHIFFSSSDWEE